MRGGLSRRGVFAATAIFACPRLALAADTFPEFPPPSAADLIVFGDSDLGVSVYPLTNTADQKTYFGLDLGAAGVLPIWLSIKNRSATQRFMIDANDITLAYGEQSLQAAERTRSTVNDTGATVMANTAAIGMAAGPIGMAVSLPILLMSGHVIARQDDLKRNLILRQFYSRTLGPDQSAAGFVYGKRGQQDTDLSRFRISIGVKPIPAPPTGGGTILTAALAAPEPNPPTP